jgi:hypothetical protein
MIVSKSSAESTNGATAAETKRVSFLQMHSIFGTITDKRSATPSLPMMTVDRCASSMLMTRPRSVDVTARCRLVDRISSSSIGQFERYGSNKHAPFMRARF